MESVATQPTSNHLNSSIYETNRDNLNKSISVSKQQQNSMVEVGEILAVGEGVEIIKQNIKLTLRK